MTAFQKTLTTYDATFNADDNHLLILRLRHFVLKTALRTITLAYSRISIRDICVKLKTDSEEETEYIVAKAIRDGVIEATIDHTGAFMQSRVARNVYETDEPQQQLTRRTTYLQNMYSETVKVSLLVLNVLLMLISRQCDIPLMLISKVSLSQHMLWLDPC
jgi:26S proteasome regulatory subunit N3